MSSLAALPALPIEEWRTTKETIHRYAQVVGKVRLKLEPYRNHWWHVPLYVATRGLTTGPIPYRGRSVEISFDFLDHWLVIQTSEGSVRTIALRDGLTVAEVHDWVLDTLAELDVEVSIFGEPFDLPGPHLADDREHSTYDADAVGRFWHMLRFTDSVLRRFAGRFTGKASPIHLFWHSFDLAHTRFSGRPVQLDGVDPVTSDAYSHEVVSVGFWAGDDEVPYPAYYAYTAPMPDGLTDEPLEPSSAFWQPKGTAVLAYDDVRAAADPEATLLVFFESAYQAGARLAGWDVEALTAKHSPDV